MQEPLRQVKVLPEDRVTRVLQQDQLIQRTAVKAADWVIRVFHTILQGRGFQKLPLPKYDYQGEGRVVVEVSVDRSGKVTQAVPGIKGSTTLDEYLLKSCKRCCTGSTV